MKTLIAFHISELQQIYIAINEQDKFNIYGYKADRLHIFDEVEVKCIYGGNTILLTRDSIQYVITTFCIFLEMALKNELPLDISLTVGKVGYFFSKKKYPAAAESDKSNNNDDIFSQYWMWSCPKNIQTWLYNLNHKIYLEISPTYPWLFSDPEKDEIYMSFDEYINNYQPIIIAELQKSLVELWIKQCYVVLQKMKTVE